MSWESEKEMAKWKVHINDFFNKYHPKMTPQVDYGINFNNYWTKLQTAVAGGSQLDMCWMHISRAQLFAAQGLLEPLDDHIKNDKPTGWPGDFYSAQVDAFRYQDKQYGIPYDWATGGLYVNVDWFKKANVDLPTEDWTFSDLLSAAKKLKAAAPNPDQSWGMLLPNHPNQGYFMVRSFGGELFKGNPVKAYLTEPGTIDAFQYIYDAMWKHKVMPTPSQQAAAQGAGNTPVGVFASGRVAMVFALNDQAFIMNSLIGNRFKWTVAPTPKGQKGRFQLVGGSAWSIPKGSPHPQTTYQCIKFALTDPANLPTTAKMGSMFVSNVKFWKDALPPQDQVDQDAFKHTFYNLGKRDGVHTPYFPGYAKWVTSIYQKNIDTLWANQQSDVSSLLHQMQTETDAFLKAGGGVGAG
jgi:ABC-type glycerol-3-phosphate transport system substrate-binding protein